MARYKPFEETRSWSVGVAFKANEYDAIRSYAGDGPLSEALRLLIFGGIECGANAPHCPYKDGEGLLIPRLVQVRMTKSEHEMFTKFAKSKNQSFSTCARHLIFGDAPYEYRTSTGK